MQTVVLGNHITFDLKKIGYAYLAAPIVVFLLFYIRPIIGVPVLLCMAIAYTCSLNKMRKCTELTDGRLSISIGMLLVVGVALLVWALLSGQAGLWYQSTDWDARNAIFRDLITHEWPVIYQSKDTALSYYIGHWMVAAAIGHALLPLFGLTVTWRIARVALLVWTWLGLMIVALLTMRYIRASSKKTQMLTVLFLIFFSGMDIVGAAIRLQIPTVFSADVLHLEWWNPFQFSSMSTCLFWAFNQAVAPWVATILFLQERDASNYILLLSGALICGPFPALGLAFLMLFQFVGDLVACYFESEKGKRVPAIAGTLKEAFSLQNVLIAVSVLVVLILYFLTNGAVTGGVSGSATTSEAPQISMELALQLFILDAGIYLMFICREKRRSPVFYGVVALLLICPFVRVGAGQDFTMRVSIPAIFALMVFCLQMVANQEGDGSSGYRFRRWLLAACLILGMATPLTEIYRGYYHVMTPGHRTIADWTVSFENTDPAINFESFDYKNTFFYKYVAAK